MVRYRAPLATPQGAVGFDPCLIKAATGILGHQGPEIVAVLSRVADGESLAPEERAFFREFAATARHVLVLNQLPPAGWVAHKEPWESRPALLSRRPLAI